MLSDRSLTPVDSPLLRGAVGAARARRVSSTPMQEEQLQQSLSELRVRTPRHSFDAPTAAAVARPGARRTARPAEALDIGDARNTTATMALAAATASSAAADVTRSYAAGAARHAPLARAANAQLSAAVHVDDFPAFVLGAESLPMLFGGALSDMDSDADAGAQGRQPAAPVSAQWSPTQMAMADFDWQITGDRPALSGRSEGAHLPTMLSLDDPLLDWMEQEEDASASPPPMAVDD